MRGPDVGGDPAEWSTLFDDVAAREPCPYCGGDAIAGTTCPKSIPCPRCGAGPGESCRRPSDHRAMTLHAERISTAEAIDAAAGITINERRPESMTLHQQLAEPDGIDPLAGLSVTMIGRMATHSQPIVRSLAAVSRMAAALAPDDPDTLDAGTAVSRNRLARWLRTPAADLFLDAVAGGYCLTYEAIEVMEDFGLDATRENRQWLRAEVDRATDEHSRRAHLAEGFRRLHDEYREQQARNTFEEA